MESVASAIRATRPTWRARRTSPGWPAAFAAAGFELALVGGPVRDAFLDRPLNDLDFTTNADPDQILAIVDADRRRALGHRPRVRHDRRPHRRPHRRDHHLPHATPTTARPASPTVAVRRHASRATWCAATSPSTRWRCACRERVLVDPSGGVEDLIARRITHAGRTGAVLRRRPAADAAGRPVRLPARVHRRPSRRERPCAQMADRISIISVERVSDELGKLLKTDAPRAGIAAAGRHGAGRARAARDARAASSRSTSTTTTRTSTSTASPCWSRRSTCEKERNPASRARPHPALGGAAARHRQAGDASASSRAGSSPSTTTTSSARSSRPSGCAQLRFDNETIACRRPADRAAPAVLRLHRGRLDRLGRAPLRARRRAAAASACTS